MKNTKIMLTSPNTFETVTGETEEKDVIVRPTHMSICNADIRYYLGERPPEVLKKKLPITLIHEAAGVVLSSKDPNFRQGDKVCIVPISRHESPYDDYNYDYPGSRFMSSSSDGCLQTLISVNRENLVKYEGIDPRHASMVELVSVAEQAIHRLQTYFTKPVKKIAVHGTGAVGFWITLLLKAYYPDAFITVVGVMDKFLTAFDFTDEAVLSESLDLSVPEYDLVVEAVGGQFSESVLQKALGQVKPTGCILLMGVSENPVNLHTRTLMEKGIILLSSHRSVKRDFEKAVFDLRTNEVIRANIHKCVSRITTVKTIEDIDNAFKDAKKYQFKTVIDWQYTPTEDNGEANHFVD